MESDADAQKIQTILKQTTYAQEEASAKLVEFCGNELAVIRHFMGIPEKKPAPPKSLNQAMYSHFRAHLDGAMKDYRDRVANGQTSHNLV